VAGIERAGYKQSAMAIRKAVDRRAFAAIILCWLAPALCRGGQDPLPSWNTRGAKAAIIDFVTRVTTAGGRDFVPPAERIATFDNDGTLWTEQPLYVQFVFALDRVRALAATHPEWKQEQPFEAAIEGDTKTLIAGGVQALMKVMAATHSGMNTDEFQAIVKSWLATSHHPRFKRSYTDLVYQPMLELLAYLRANAFKTYIVSGGGVEFMRAWAEKTYGIPPEQVIGSMGKLKYETRDGQPVLMLEQGIDLIDDHAGKPVGIQKFIGRRPIFAAGNSDGDLEMLQWTTSAAGPRFGMLVRHTDAKREFAYDRQSEIGRLDKALDEAGRRRWLVVDMKEDWKTIYPFELQR
jgi:phosphoglycolate phosphatase-like HAD superfamily hydrolase